MTEREVSNLQDWRGNYYGKGSYVIYPRTSGRSVEMAFGKVVRIYEKFQPGRKSWDGGKWVLNPWEPLVEIEVFKSSRFDMFSEDSPTKVTIKIIENITAL